MAWRESSGDLALTYITQTHWKIAHLNSKPSGGRLNIKMSSYQYRDSHVKDKTVSPTVLSLTWESPYLGKTVFILRRGPGQWVNSLTLGMRQWTMSSLVQIMGCRLFGTKPLPEPLLKNCEWNFDRNSWKCVWKCCLRNGDIDLDQFWLVCLTATNYYLNQCWLLIGEYLWHSPWSTDICVIMDLKFIFLKLSTAKFPRAHLVNELTSFDKLLYVEQFLCVNQAAFLWYRLITECLLEPVEPRLIQGNDRHFRCITRWGGEGQRCLGERAYQQHHDQCGK